MFFVSTQKAGADEYKILALRVDFPYEEPDHDTTSGRGSFDLRDYYADEEVREQFFHPWDIPPHDSTYFSNHLSALDNYWSTVSEGRVTISAEIWPRDDRGAYTMSKKFYKYGNGRIDEQVDKKLVDLFREAVETCKQQEGISIDFSDYDTFMIIHAGIGQETSLGLNDIRSAYLSSEDFNTYLDSTLTIDGVTFDNGIIVPESASSIGVGGLNGILAQMFGHRLGLPSLSNNEDGLPGAGGWCLMDTGSMAWGYSTRGFSPTHPCIWSKIELGWLEPVVVTSDTTIDIAATHSATDVPRALKIPISDDEYLLIENRLRYTSRDSLATAVYSDTDSSGVWMSVDHIDSYIPGSGLLIWHINDSIIREKRAEGAINNDMLRRGIDLLEADGRQDIGAFFGFGDDRAEYSEGHDDDTYKLSETSVLSPLTSPHSGSMWGGRSGITVEVLSDPGEIMRVSVSFGGKLPGFPVSVGAGGTLTAVDLLGDDGDELLVTSENTEHNANTVRIITPQGSVFDSLLTNFHPPTFRFPGTNKNGLFIAYASEFILLYPENGTLQGSTSNWDIFSDYTMKFESMLTFAGANETTDAILFDRKYYYQGDTISSSLSTITNIGINSLPKPSFSFPDTVHIKNMAAAQYNVSVVSESNTLYLCDLNSGTHEEHQITADSVSGLAMADLNRDDQYETIIVTDSELLIYQPDGSYDITYLSYQSVGEPAVADIDGDGYPEIILCTEKGLFAYRNGGIPVDGFPYYLPPGNPDERITSPPIVADLSGSGTLDIAFATSGMRLIAYDRSGLLTKGFPIAMAGAVTGSPAVFRHNDAGTLAVAYITDDGKLMAHDLDVTADNRLLAWPMMKGGPQLNAALINDDISAGVKKTAPFSYYCYPNPITGSTGTFRITPDKPTDCTITVFSAAGRRVFNRHLSENDIIPGVPNDIRMDASNLSSGLYIARIKTKSGTVTYKLGVLK